MGGEKKRKRSIMDDAVESTSDNSTTRVLPNEMLSHIFAFLPLMDRKRVRLTCRLWYECCTSVNVTKHEKFVFRTDDPGGEHIGEVILRLNYSLLNLDFQCIPENKMLSENVWKACGQRIRELEFFMCEWDDDDETIRDIILHCENLTRLVITEDEDRRPGQEQIQIVYSPRLLNDLIEKGIRRPKLHTLSIFIEYHEHESVLRKIFLLYPCIKHFTFKMYSHSSKFLDPFAVKLGLNPDTQLESLTALIITSDGYLGTLGDQTGPQLRLKYLETYVEMSPNVENKIFNFFRSQRNLEGVKLWTKIPSKDLFYHILESCPNLREFRIDSVYSMGLKPSEVSRFIASISKLKFLQLDFNVEDIEQVPSFSDLLPNTVQFNNLTALSWYCELVENSNFCAAFLQRCSSLKHLLIEVVRCWDSTLQTIFQYMPELETLVLLELADCTDFGFTGRTVDGKEDGYSIKRLQQLKRLELFGGRNTVLTERTMLELQLPRLEFLSLDVGWYDQLSEEALNLFASHLPELRTLVMHPYRNEDDYIENRIPRLCKQLNNLHRLILHSLYPRGFDHDSNREDELVDNIFSACPSLRYISVHGTAYTYRRDPFIGTVFFEGLFKFPGTIFD